MRLVQPGSRPQERLAISALFSRGCGSVFGQGFDSRRLHQSVARFNCMFRISVLRISSVRIQPRGACPAQTCQWMPVETPGYTMTTDCSYFFASISTEPTGNDPRGPSMEEYGDTFPFLEAGSADKEAILVLLGCASTFRSRTSQTTTRLPGGRASSTSVRAILPRTLYTQWPAAEVDGPLKIACDQNTATWRLQTSGSRYAGRHT